MGDCRAESCLCALNGIECQVGGGGGEGEGGRGRGGGKGEGEGGRGRGGGGGGGGGGGRYIHPGGEVGISLQVWPRLWQPGGKEGVR